MRYKTLNTCPEQNVIDVTILLDDAMPEQLIIVGGGPAGLAAAIYAAREGFNPLVVAGANPGGQLLLTTTVENFPGFPDGVLGSDLIALLRKQAERFGTRFIDSNVTGVDFGKKPYTITVDEKKYEAESVIIATGANAKWLGIESEKRFIGHGVSSCATCDGPFFRDRNVIVVGGGDTAMEDSLFLTRFVKSVHIVHRRDELRASKIMQERARNNPKISFVWNSTVEEILGDSRVRSVKLRNLITGEVTETSTDGVFVAIGYQPNTTMLGDALPLDNAGYVITKEEVLTDLEGVYVAGDVSDRYYRQAATAVASGVKAALHAREYLQQRHEG
jgi:thioredoxin reductase (NADPH)